MATTTTTTRLAALKTFDDTKRGVHGLVADGATKLPSIFVLPADQRPGPTNQLTNLEVPVVDVSGDRPAAVAAVRRACEDWGFFQVVGHGVPAAAVAAAVEAVRAFNEGDDGDEVKARLYSREGKRAVKYVSNSDLFESKTANWKDTLYCRMAPEPPAGAAGVL